MQKPKRSSIPKGIDAATIDLERALQLLSLPREVGPHPEGGTITAGLGRFGPFILHENGDSRPTPMSIRSRTCSRSASTAR